MRKNKTYHRKKTVLLWALCMGMMVGLAGRLVYLCVFRSVYYSEKADDLHERERGIKAARGRILDANGEVLAANRTVCTISVIHSQIEEPEAVIAMLVKELGISEETARKRVEKRSSIERVKTNVDKETGDTIRSYGYAGVKVDEDFKRYYPKGKLASRVIGFTGGDNQGIIGLEVEYEEILKGINGKILTTTDARGIEQNGIGESRQEPVAGRDLKVSLDVNIQAYCQQAAEKAMAEKQADSVSILLMNPQNGEIYACVNVPEFDLNDPFALQQDTTGLSEKEIQDLLNQMWRNACINVRTSRDLPLRSSRCRRDFRRALCRRTIRFSVPATKSWRTAGSTATSGRDTEPKTSCRARRTRATRCSLKWGCGSVWKSSVITSGISV